MFTYYREVHGDDPGRSIVHPWGWLEYRFGPGQTMELVNIWVDQEYRDKGLGTTLIRELEDMVLDGKTSPPSVKVASVYGFVREENNAVWDRFYRRLGYRALPLIDFYGRGRHARMVFKLLPVPTQTPEGGKP